MVNFAYVFLRNLRCRSSQAASFNGTVAVLAYDRWAIELTGGRKAPTKVYKVKWMGMEYYSVIELYSTENDTSAHNDHRPPIYTSILFLLSLQLPPDSPTHVQYTLRIIWQWDEHHVIMGRTRNLHTQAIEGRIEDRLVELRDRKSINCYGKCEIIYFESKNLKAMFLFLNIATLQNSTKESGVLVLTPVNINM